MKIGIAAVGLFLMTLSAAGQQSARGCTATSTQAGSNVSVGADDAEIAHEDHVQARASLLPSVSENTESSTLPWASVERTTSRSLLIDSLIRP
ncbi:MAG TPA: hypothetical protein VM912_02475 [Terriglobales bacterium]|nr:hypothetical protein [Terriglobales bacterium]